MRARLALVLLLAASPAAAAVTVLGGGDAESCSKAALVGRADDLSIRSCDRALENEALQTHDRAGTFINRGVMKLRRRDYTAALVDFNSGIALDQRIGEGYANRGATLVGEHRYKDALSDIDQALNLGVKEPEKAYFNRALAYEGLDDEKDAYLDYTRASTLKPDWDAPKTELLRFKVRSQ